MNRDSELTIIASMSYIVFADSSNNSHAKYLSILLNAMTFHVNTRSHSKVNDMVWVVEFTGLEWIVQGLCFSIQCLELLVYGLWVYGLGVGNWGLGFRVYGIWYRV